MKGSRHVREEAVLFGTGDSLVGVITDPTEASRGRTPPAFIFLNAGVTHRVGPNRLYVRLARSLASQGFIAMRFDFSGLGDSSVRTDDLPVEQSVIVEVREAMDLLKARRGTEQFILIGICSGATVSFMMAKEDRRVVGAVLINAQGHFHGTDPDRTARLRDRTMARHSWRIALKSSFRAKNLRKALGGQLNPIRILKMMVGLPLRVFSGGGGGGGAGKTSEAPEVDAVQELLALEQRGVRVYHLYCEGDEGLDYFHVVLGDQVESVLAGDGASFEIVRGSNHMFTLRWTQDHLETAVCDWARTLP
jgi:pimeloyl-ACP methyl ester carboxylesterase